MSGDGLAEEGQDQASEFSIHLFAAEQVGLWVRRGSGGGGGRGKNAWQTVMRIV